MPRTAVQKVVPPTDIALANSVLLLFQQLGPAVFVAVAQTPQLNPMVPQMQLINPALTSNQIVEAGAIGATTWYRKQEYRSSWQLMQGV